MISIKTVLISTGIAAITLFLKSYVPVALDASISGFPILWSFFLSWLKPPYVFFVINVIITILVASSRYYRSIGEYDSEDYVGECKILTDEPIVSQAEVKNVDLDTDFDLVATVLPPVIVAEADRSEEEKEISEVVNYGDEFVELRSEWNQVPTMIEESENLLLTEKLVDPASSGHRKPVKANPKGCIRKKALRVVKPKRHVTLENAWKIVTEEGESTPLTGQYQRPDTFGLEAGEVKAALRKSETFKDVTNYYRSPNVTPTVKKQKKKEMSPSGEELNRRIEAFIRKSKEERLESMRLDREVEA